MSIDMCYSVRRILSAISLNDYDAYVLTPNWQRDRKYQAQFFWFLFKPFYSVTVVYIFRMKKSFPKVKRFFFPATQLSRFRYEYVDVQIELFFCHAATTLKCQKMVSFAWNV